MYEMIKKMTYLPSSLEIQVSHVAQVVPGNLWNRHYPLEIQFLLSYIVILNAKKDAHSKILICSHFFSFESRNAFSARFAGRTRRTLGLHKVFKFPANINITIKKYKTYIK